MPEDTIEDLEKRLAELGSAPDQGESGRKKVRTLNDLAYAVYRRDPEKAMNYANQAFKLAEALDYKQGVARSYQLIGISKWVTSNYEEALECHLKAMEIFAEADDKTGLANSYNNIGLIYKNRGDYDKALEYYLRALKLNKETGNKQGLAAVSNNIGIIYKGQNDYDLALEYYLKSLSIKESLGNKAGMASSYSNIGVIYKNRGDYDKALDYYIKALRIKKKAGDKQGLANSYNNIGVIYEKRDDYDKALHYYLKAVSIFEMIGDKQGITISCSNIGRVHTLTGDYDSALSYLQRGLHIACEIGAKNQEMSSYEELAELYEAQANFEESLSYYKKYSELKKQIFGEESAEKIARIQVRYETEKKEREVEVYRLKNVELQREITGRKKAQEVLWESEETFRNLVERANDGITIVREGLLEYVNPRLAQLLGYGIEELRGTPFTGYIDPRELPKVSDYYRRRMAGEEVPSIYETILLHRDGRRVHMELNAGIITYQGKPADLVFIRDITERKLRQLRQTVRAELLDRLRRTANITECLQSGCQAVRDAELFKRAILALQNEKGQITHLGQVGLDPEIIEEMRKVASPDKKPFERMLSKEFKISHSFFIPAEAGVDFAKTGRYFPQEGETDNIPNSWKTGDELYVPMLGKNGSTRSYLSVDTPFDGRRPDKSLILYLEDIVDIVVRQVREIQNIAALVESEENYRNIFEHSPAGIVIHQKGKILFVNPAMVQMLGYETVDEVVGKPVLDFVHPDYRKHAQENIKIVLSREGRLGELSETRLLRRNGSPLDVTEIAQTIAYKGESAIQGYILDNTKRKLAEEELHRHREHLEELVDERAAELQESEERYRSLTEQALVGVYIYRKGHFLFVNHEMEEITGYSRAELLSMDSKKLEAPDHMSNPKIREEIRQQEDANVHHYFMHLMRKNGQIAVLEFRTRPIVYKDKEAVMGNCIDITERMRIQEQLLRSTRLASLGVFAAGIAHQVNNPLAVMLLNTGALNDLLNEDIESVEEFRKDCLELLADLEAEIYRTRKVVKNLLAFTREKDVHVSPTDVNAVVRNALDLLSRHLSMKEIRVQMSLQASLSPAFIDPQGLEQVMVNVIQNAYDALEGSGKVLICTETGANRMIRIVISNNGPPIPEHMRERIFEPLFTTKPGERGTGLGLSIGVMLLERFGARIYLESSRDELTTFVIEVPIAGEEER
jgi:PAS domain S-box-containing protein